MNRLADKVAIVTGGARGMGAATSRLFVAEGAKVAIADVLEAEGAALARELGPAARYHHHDVTDAGSWARLVREVEAELGPVDVLVNNAGIIAFGRLVDTSAADFDRVLGVNLKGPFLGIKAVAPGMTARRRGSIVNISSIEGVRGTNGLVAYSTSKWGVRGLTRVAAMELGPHGVRVNSIHPGGVDTVMGNPGGQARSEIDKVFSGIPAQRVGAPEEIARVSLFLASDESSYMMGAELVVDGGMTTGAYQPVLPGTPDPAG
jgi:3alpha(or 20beta)-hydroxysteroid dehydrogenase